MKRLTLRQVPQGDRGQKNHQPLSSWLTTPEPRFDRPRRYDLRPARPSGQLALQVGLWAAVALGAIGGLVGLLRSPAPAEVAAEPGEDDWIVPGSVSAYAELVVEEWLTTTTEGRADLAGLFVDPPPVADPPSRNSHDGALDVRRVVAVAGHREIEDYWTVTVRADVLAELAGTGGAPAEGEGPGDEGIDDGDGATAGDDGTEDESADGEGGGEPVDQVETWYLEVGVVSDGQGDLVAIAMPAVVPRPAPTEGRWRVGQARDAVEDGDPLAATVQEFLNAFLAGNGPVSRYLAPGVEVEAASPAPFAAVSVEQLATEARDDGTVWVLADVVAETPAGARLLLTYDLVLTQPADRWEVLEVSGSPSLVEAG